MASSYILYFESLLAFDVLIMFHLMEMINLITENCTDLKIVIDAWEKLLLVTNMPKNISIKDIFFQFFCHIYDGESNVNHLQIQRYYSKLHRIKKVLIVWQACMKTILHKTDIIDTRGQGGGKL